MEQFWQEVKSVLSQKIPEHSYKMWIEPLALASVSQNTLTLTCPNLFFRKRIAEHFKKCICSELDRVAGRTVKLDLVVSTNDQQPDTVIAPQQIPLPDLPAQPNYGRLFRKDYTFDHFVVGKNNDFAYSAALSLAAHSPSQQHSLFLLSKTGLGKSHLSQAIGHHIMIEKPTDRLYYMTAEDFSNEMVASYKTNSVNRFKEKYNKKCDVLLLEDVHYLSGKERTQIELAHTLDSLFNENKKIIFSSCYLPSEIPKLSDTLRSRLTSGLISNIDPPKFRMRTKILKRYAKQNHWTFPMEVLEYVASELVKDVRQLKSGLAGIAAKASLMGRSIDLKLAASVIQNMVQTTQEITVVGIKKMVCKYYNVTPKELVSRSRKQSIVRPRQVAIYLSRQYTDQSLQSIGKSFNRYHATALHAIGMVEKGIKQGSAIQRHVEYLTEKIESGSY